MDKSNSYKDYNTKVCSNKIFTIPNVLSMFRIALIPVMVLLYFKQQYLMGAIVLAVSGITDVVDGFIARKFNMVSELGKAIDPIADKLTLAVILFCLIFEHDQMWLPFIIFLVKEIFNGTLQLAIMLKHRVVVGADWYGKITTAFLYAMIFVHLVWRDIPDCATWILASISFALMVFSLVMYAIRNLKIIKTDENFATSTEDTI